MRSCNQFVNLRLETPQLKFIGHFIKMSFSRGLGPLLRLAVVTPIWFIR